MSRQLVELETILTGLIAEHRELLVEVDRHETAMKKVDLEGMEKSRRIQEELRQRIAHLDSRRRAVVQQLAMTVKQPAATMTISKLAELHPQSAPRLLKLRDELKDLATKISQRTRVGAKMASAVLGHLNTVVRLLAGAMQQAGIYTKKGMPKLAERIGAIEAVG
jgi:FlgN protein